MKNSFALVLVLFSALSCSMATKESSTAYEARLYGEGRIITVYFAWNGSGYGEVWGSAADGETFQGEYTTVSPEFYGTDLSAVFGRIGSTGFSAVRPSFWSMASTVQYGLASAVGNKETTIVCKYMTQATDILRAGFSFRTTGTCLDSRQRNYVMHGGSEKPVASDKE